MYSNVLFTLIAVAACIQKAYPSGRLGGGWPNAKVYYTLDPKFTDNERSEVEKAFKNYHDYTCVRFVPRKNEPAFVRILRDDQVCGVATVCRTGGEQEAKFGGSCITSGVMTHELGHTLCFGHEQSREDRDEYLGFGNCEVTGKDLSKDGWTTDDILYDYVSIQHYEGECYNGCFKPKLPGVTKCGSGGPVGVLDGDKINTFYNCTGCWSYRWRKGNLSLANENWPSLTGLATNNDVIFPCRAYHNGDIIPGKGIPGRGCWVPYGGGEYFHNDYYEMLTNPMKVNLNWVKFVNGKVPSNAIRAGRTSERETLYLGRCKMGKSRSGKDAFLFGKIHPSAFNGTYIPEAGQERVCKDSDILVCS